MCIRDSTCSVHWLFCQDAGILVLFPGFLTGRPRGPTPTKASVSSPGSGTDRGSTWSASISGELGESLVWGGVVASDCVLDDAPEAGISAIEREVRRPEAARLPPAVTRDLGSGPSRIASGTTGTLRLSMSWANDRFR